MSKRKFACVHQSAVSMYGFCTCRKRSLPVFTRVLSPCTAVWALRVKRTSMQRRWTITRHGLWWSRLPCHRNHSRSHFTSVTIRHELSHVLPFWHFLICNVSQKTFYALFNSVNHINIWQLLIALEVFENSKPNYTDMRINDFSFISTQNPQIDHPTPLKLFFSGGTKCG